MSRRSLSLALAVSVALNLSAIVAVFYYRLGAPLHSQAADYCAVQGAIREYLDLTEEQRTHIQQMQRGFVAEMGPLRADVRRKNAELVTAVADGADAQQVSKLLDESAALHRRMQSCALSYLRREAETLDRQQLSSLLAAITDRIRTSGCAGQGGAGMGLGVPQEQHDAETR